MACRRHRASKARAFSLELHGWLALRFVEPELEAAFQDEQLEFGMQRRARQVLALSGLALLYTATLGSSTESSAWVARGVLSLLAVFYLLLLWLLVRQPYRIGSWYASAMTGSLIFAATLASLTRDRWAALLGHGSVSTAGSLAEAGSILALSGVLNVAAFFLQLPSACCLLLMHFAIVIYLAIVGFLGSPEHTCMDQVQEQQVYHRMVYHCVLVAEFYLIALLTYYSRRCQEINERRKFAISFLELAKQEWDAAECREVLARQNELDQRQHALMTPQASIEDSAEHSLEETSDGSLSPEGSASVEGSQTSSRKKLGRWSKFSRAAVESMQTSSDTSSGSAKGPRRKPAGHHRRRSPTGTAANAKTDGGFRMVPQPPKETEPETTKLGSKSLSDGEPAPAPNTKLTTAMANRTSDWTRIRRMAEQVRNPDYKLHDFFQDCLASFPELRLFSSSEQHDQCRMTASGRSAEVEYQRTIGALFAVYWLLRLDLDGCQSFCYGVGDDWDPHVPGSPTSEANDPWGSPKLFSQMSNDEKRAHFMLSMNWSKFEELVAQAGCGPDTPERVDCIMAMLCLTSFHDIMKMEELLPTVQAEHGTYCGYVPGTVINDHDTALAYVLEHYPLVLPSFGGLQPSAQQLVIFSQGKMQFNHGWFVQAEAPPGAMLSKFKKVLATGASPRCIGFYFFHWITDLAGAEGTPLGGAEKFVLKFPHDVLCSFLWSMPCLGRLVDMTETAVVEAYLKDRWQDMAPAFPLPSDNTAIARMRLAVMVQEVRGTSEAFNALHPREQAILSEELARTGCQGQHYSMVEVAGGPAFLMYYAPAVLQQHAGVHEDLCSALTVLAKVLSAARTLWPLRSNADGTTVTIQVGELRCKSLETLVGSPAEDHRQVWILIRQNDLDGVVMLRQAGDLNFLYAKGLEFLVLDFSRFKPCISLGRKFGARPSHDSHATQNVCNSQALSLCGSLGKGANACREYSQESQHGMHATTTTARNEDFMPCVPDHSEVRHALSMP